MVSGSQNWLKVRIFCRMVTGARVRCMILQVEILYRLDENWAVGLARMIIEETV